MQNSHTSDPNHHLLLNTPKKRLFRSGLDSEPYTSSVIGSTIHENTFDWGSNSQENLLEPNSRKRFRRSSYSDSVGLSDSQETVDKPLRSKWTSEESKSLIKGCYEYGVGAWKRILVDPKYSFHGRTAVDLKDRFRTIFPRQYNLLYSTKTDSTTEMSPSASNFRRVSRRPRKKFTEEDDCNLLLGVKKHGCSWSKIVQDEELKLCDRHSMDLRDRFRIAFPEAYERFGYAPKSAQPSPRSGSRVRRNEYCAELVREESREISNLYNSLSPVSEEPSQVLVRDSPNHLKEAVNCMENRNYSKELHSTPNDEYQNVRVNHRVIESTPDIELDETYSNKRIMFNSRTEIMHSTPMSGARLSRHSPAHSPENSSYDTSNESSSSIPTTTVKHTATPYHASTSSSHASKSVGRPSTQIFTNNTTLTKSPASEYQTSGGFDSTDKLKNVRTRYSPVKRTIPVEPIANDTPTRTIKFINASKADAIIVSSDCQGIRYSPVRTIPQQSKSNRLGGNSPSATSTNELPSTQHLPVRENSQLIDLSSDRMNKRIRLKEDGFENEDNTTKSMSISSTRVHRTTKTATASSNNHEGDDFEFTDKNLSSTARVLEPIRFSPIKKRLQPTPSHDTSSIHVDQTSLRAAPGRSHSAPTSSQKTIRYSPVKHLSRKPRKASKSVSSTHQLSAKSTNPSSESYPQLQQPHEINEKSLTSNTENNKHSRPNRNQSEVPSIPELTDEANEGSDYESSDFVDSPDHGTSGYASMKISCATQTPISSNNLEASNLNKQLFTHPNQRPNDLLTASIPLPSAPETLQKNLAGESQNTPDPNINYTKCSDSSSTIFSSQASPIQGKIVGVRIRNGVVEYKYKFPTVWKSSNELEDQETLIQNFMDTLTSKTSLVRVTSITSNDSSIQH